MTYLPGRRTALTVILLITWISCGHLNALTPGDEQWLSFMEWNHGDARLPEDESMGLLADRRSPDPLWASALVVCDRALSSIRQGEIPEAQIHPDIRIPLTLEFTEALKGGGKDVYPRYGLPNRENRRVTVPVRLAGTGLVNYGYIYLSRWEGEWFIDQWALDLSEFPDTDPGDE